MQSFTSTKANGIYGPTTTINITANYSENLAVGSTVTAVLNTGASVTLNTITGNTTLTGTYTVGATGSGQNTNDLTVTSISSQNSCDGAANCQIGTIIPSTNIANGSDIIIDTTAPTAPSTVSFISNPINNGNVITAILRVDGEAGSTIYYSINDTDGGTSAVSGNLSMEGDGSTNISNLNFSGLTDGILTATVYLRDPVGNNSGNSTNTVIKDTTNPTFTIQYYSDAGLITSLGNNPRLKAGIYYLKITAGETLNATPTISLDAQGSANDIANAGMTLVSGNDYSYTRTITSDALATGTILETITITGTDSHGNTITNTPPTNTGTKASYTDTIKPTVSGVVTPSNANARTVSINLTFNENENQTIAPTVLLRKQDNTTLSVTGSYINATTWTGTATVSGSDANGATKLEVSIATDLAGNIMDANTDVATFTIDTVNPSLTINSGVDVGPTKNDTIDITTNDNGSGIASQFYGYSANNICDINDTIATAFTSGTNFTITGDHTDYLCTKAIDNAGNIGYQLIGQLNTDNTAPRINSISSTKANGSYKAGEVIDINLTFSENVTSVGNVTVTLETGTIDRNCTFQVTNSNTASCNYTVQTGDTSADLATNSIAGIINDQASNAMSTFTPITTLATNKNLIIDTTSAVVNIISPLNGNSVNGATLILFSDGESTTPQCSFDNTNWIACNSGVTTLGNLTNWTGLADGSFTLYLRDTDVAGNIGTDNETGILKDTAAPRVQNISSNHADGHFKVGEIIDINLTFSRNVTSTGNITVTLETGAIDRSCTFQVTNSNTGACNYTVQAGDTSADLTVYAISGIIKDQVNNAMTNYTPITNLAANKNIVIDTTLPTITSISSNHSDGIFNEGETIDINVAFSEIVTSSSYITVTLDSGGSCTFTATNSNTGTCNYIVATGQNSTDLNVTSISGTIGDQANNSMINFVPLTNLAANKNIVIDTTTQGSPTIFNITSTKINGAYKEGTTIPINVTFSENVTSAGNVIVTLETGTTDRSCTFQVTNSNVGSCDYTVQAGDASTDLDTLSISGTINDQASNPMLNFTPATTLASNKNIIIDTALPTVPIITLLDPITDANKNVATITGTGEANATLNYSIDDTNGNTATKVGTGTVNGSGNINLTNINLTGLDGGTLTATAYLTDAAGNVGPNGTDTATSTIVLPTIASISSTKADGSYTIGETIPINVTFSESVTSTGNVTVTLETGTTDHSCTFQVTNSNTGSCDYTVEDGDASTDLNVNSVAGTIADMSGNPMLNFTPATNLATNKNIIIDTSSLILVSFTSTAADGTYGPLAPINITATYSANLNVGSSITLNLSTGATATLNTVSGNKLIGTYTVGVAGSDEGTNDLSVSQITAHNSCDIAHNCTNGTNLPLTNISDGSNIAIDAVSPVFSAILPYSSSNIDNLNSNSDISYTLSETLTSGSIVIIQTAREEDSNSPHLCTLTGTNLQVGAHTNFDTSACAEGEITLVNGAIYSFSFNGEDSYGNIADEVLKTGVSFGLDIISPTISNVLITNITSSSAVVSWETNENANSLVDYGLSTVYGETVGDANNSTMIHSVEITNLLSGTTYSLRVRSADSSNNVRIEDNNGVGYSFATLAMPNISNINVTDLTHDSAIVNWNTSAETFGYVEYGTTSSYGRILGNEDELLSDHTIAITGLFSQTLYHYRVRIKDSFGNYSVSGDETFETLIDTEDVTPPVITAVSATNVTSKRATITWTTDELTNSYVEYGITELYGEKYGNDILTTNHSVILPASLTEKTTYHFRVSSSDSAKNKTTSIDYTFTTIDKAINTDLETGNNFSNISGIKLSSITSSSAIASWKTAQVCNGIVRYGLDTKYGYSAAEDATIGSYATFATAHEVTVTNLLSNSKYNYQIISYDAEGNISISQNMTFSTSALSSISKVTVNDITLTSATIIWETGDPTTSEVEYGLSSNYGQIQKNAVLSNFHKVELKDLATGQNYHFRIKGKIDNSNLISSDDYVFATYPKPEVQKYELKKVTDSEATISWDTNIPTESTIEYININNPEDKGTQGLATTANKHELTVSGLDQGSEYEIKIKGTDVNKNTFESKPFKIKTDMDVAPPVITHVNTESSLVNKKDAQVQSIIFWKTDEPATSQVFFDVGMNKSNDYTKSSKEDSNLTTNHLVVLPDLKPGLVYRFKVVSKDKNSNEQNSDTYSLLTPRKDQSVIQLIIGNFEQTFGWMKKIKM